MRFWNRWKLLASYLLRRERVPALPVEYIVETTAKCNLYCPMCVRETYKQPKADMSDDSSAWSANWGPPTHDAIGRRALTPRFRPHRTPPPSRHLDPFLDQRHVPRRAHCPPAVGHPLDHHLSFDGASKETFEYYRKGARFDKVRDNFVRFARL